MLGHGFDSRGSKVYSQNCSIEKAEHYQHKRAATFSKVKFYINFRWSWSLWPDRSIDRWKHLYDGWHTHLRHEAREQFFRSLLSCWANNSMAKINKNWFETVTWHQILIGPWRGQRARLLLQQSEFEIPLKSTFFSIKFVLEKTKLNKKRPGLIHIRKQIFIVFVGHR